MKKIFKLFIYLFICFISIMVFLPKESFYNLLEKELQSKQIIISNEIKKEGLFDFKVFDADIFYQGISMAKLKKLTFDSYFLYTKITIKDVSFLDNFKAFVPSPIEELTLQHSIIDINKIKIDANGNFGQLKGEVNILSRVMILEIIASNEMKNSYSKLLKNMKFENERYIYEYKF